jgi:hypothetical protein
MGRRVRRAGILRTSKEHARNMLGTCLLLLHCSGGAPVLLRPWAYFSGGGATAQVRLKASLWLLLTCRV